MIGEQLKELRRKKNLSQDQLAEKLGITRQSISKWENNITMPDLENLMLMSEFYGVSLDKIVKGEEEQKETEPIEETTKKRKGLEVESNFISCILIAMLTASAMVPVVGIIVSVVTLYITRTIKSKFWKYLVRIVCIIVLILSIYNCYVLFLLYFVKGEGTVEYLG